MWVIAIVRFLDGRVENKPEKCVRYRMGLCSIHSFGVAHFDTKRDAIKAIMRDV